MDKMIGIIDLQHKLRAVFNEVTKHGTPYILTRGKQPEAVLIPYQMYMRFARADETGALKRFDTLLERMAAVNAKYSDEEVETDLEEATKIVRGRRKKA